MAFLGYERPIEYTGQQIFDPTMAKMVLDAQDKYFNAVYADYQQGLENMKEFNKEYGDFITPILADQEWYNNNVTGRIRNFINDAYSKGIDLTRSAEGRAAIAQMINSIDVGSVAKLRTSAENAKEYLKERAKLELQGLYNPLMERYAGEGLDTFDTLRGGKIWDRMSPVPYQNMADFSKAYFDNISPMQRSATKNGISYTISEITEPMLQDIADRHFNDLVQTPQGQLMYKYYKDVYGSDVAARKAFNDAVVSGNLDRRKYADNYDEMNLKQQGLDLQRQQVAISRERLQLAKQKQKAAEEEKANGWTRRQTWNIIKNGKKGEDASKFGGTKGLSLKDRDDFARNYSAYQTKLVPGSHDMNTARALLSGLTTPVSIAEAEVIKRRPVSFTSGSGINFTAHRQYAYGGRTLTDGSVSNKLLNYMRNKRISGYVVYDDDISVNKMDYAQDAHVWDINGYVRVKKSDLEGFGKNLDTALKKIGATEYKTEYKVGQYHGKPKKESVEYIDIPVSRTIDSRGFSDSEIDMLGDALNLTKSVTAKRQDDYEEDAYED